MTVRKLNLRQVRKIKAVTVELFVVRHIEGNKPRRVWKA